MDGVEDAIALTGRGRVDTVALPASLAPQKWQLSHDYQSLLAITSALVGVSRERVQALLGLR